MEICVCVKQVPDIREIKIDRETNNLIRQGVTNVINPFDEYALKAGINLRNCFGGGLCVLTMGPESAVSMLKNCIACGADEAYLISGSEFAGADTLSTSYTLSMGIRTIEEMQGKRFDLIICGQQAIDGETAQVGPEVAQMLDLAQVTGVYEIDKPAAGDGEIIVKRALDLGYEKLSIALPALISVTKMKEGLPPPSIRAKINSSSYHVKRLDKNNISGLDIERCGIRGSATRVKSTYVISHSVEGAKVFNGLNEEAQSELKKLLEKAGTCGQD